MFLVARYRTFVNSRPFTAQITTTGSLFAVGDVVAQKVYEPFFSTDTEDVKSNDGYDYLRTLKMATYGLCIAAPTTWTWYKFLEGNVVFKNTLTTTITRVGLDQAIFAPSFITVFFTYNGLLAGNTLLSTFENLKTSFKETLMANYKVWPFVQLLNFYFIPLQYRLAVVNTVAVGWNGYLSWKQKQTFSRKN